MGRDSKTKDLAQTKRNTNIQTHALLTHVKTNIQQTFILLQDKKTNKLTYIFLVYALRSYIKPGNLRCPNLQGEGKSPAQGNH